MVGRAIHKNGLDRGHEILTAERSQLDLKSSVDVLNFMKANQPDSVILAAARVGGIYANMSQKTKFLTENLEIQNSVILGALESGVKHRTRVRKDGTP